MAQYKFIQSMAALPHILSGAIKFARIDELNDPSEMVARVVRDEVLRSRDELMKRGYTDADMENLRRQERLLDRLAPEALVIRTPLTAKQATQQISIAFYQNIELLEARLQEAAALMAERVGVFCVAETVSCLPLWAHYASMGKGFAVEYRDLDTVFHGDDTGVLNGLVPVRYSRDHLGVTFETRSHESIFFSKFPDWSYEREIRVVVPLKDCRQVKVDGGEIYCRDLPKEHVARIICGWKMPDCDRRTIVDEARHINPDVEVCVAKIVGGEVRIEPGI
jgi:hypothetical protein